MTTAIAHTPPPARPELVFVPARSRADDDRREVVLDMRRRPDGRLALPVYSSVTGLVAAHGLRQPWACFPLTRVLTALDGGEVARVVVDPPAELQAGRWAKVSLGEYDARDEAGPAGADGPGADGRGAEGRGADGRGADGRGADGRGADGRGGGDRVGLAGASDDGAGSSGAGDDGTGSYGAGDYGAGDYSAGD